MTFDFHTWSEILEQVFLFGSSAAAIHRIVHCRSNGGAWLGPKISTIKEWLHDFYNHGKIGPYRKRRHKGWSRIEPDHLEIVIEALKLSPTAYYAELCDLIFMQTGHTYVKEQMCEALNKAGWTRKVLDYRAIEQCAPVRLGYRINMERIFSSKYTCLSLCGEKGSRYWNGM
jgi:transposase